jgi:hypothetical protein
MVQLGGRHKWVLRGQDVGSGTVRARPDCIVADDYDTLMEFLPFGLTKLTRHPDDDPVIYETWI